MAISESDISIIIPTYKYVTKVTRALESALASGAGEIIVLDDHSQDGSIEKLLAYSDPRLTIIENDCTLGLWENHYKGLKLATKSWIKFIQADDYLLPNGLAAYAAAVEPGTSVIAGLPLIKDDVTGDAYLVYELQAPLTLEWKQFEKLSAIFGNFLGSPSYTMLRADVIDLECRIWNSHLSVDMIIGAIAADKGLVVVLPPGAIGHGAHPLQDSKTQSATLGLERMVLSLEYLRRYSKRLKKLSNIWFILNLKVNFRTGLRGILRREERWSAIPSLLWRMITDLTISDWRDILELKREWMHANRFRRSVNPPFCVLDALRDDSKELS